MYIHDWFREEKRIVYPPMTAGGRWHNKEMMKEAQRCLG